jgi:16S rRNA U516 pseudouridylate synthase RsuA-like enzyme/predicted CoA-binding protein
MAGERLQKILSRAGVASRRKAEELISQGRVTVNGIPVSALGSKADPDRDHIKVDGKLLRFPKNFIYIALHKPTNCVTTVRDPQGRRTVIDLLKKVEQRVYPVGRLDYHSEGLLLLTNDGDFAHALTSASAHVPKKYLVKINGRLTPEQEQAFREGIPLGGRRTQTFWPLGREAEAGRDRPARTGPAPSRCIPPSRPSGGGAAETISHPYGSMSDGIMGLLRTARTIAVVGLSSKRHRPSNGVSKYMQSAGYRIIPVNPMESEVLGETSYPDLDSVPDAVDIVNIFRRSEHVPGVVEAAIRKGARAIWMQEGVWHEGAAERARSAGLDVIMDRCILKEHRKLAFPEKSD